jgi:hypothetical protein
LIEPEDDGGGDADCGQEGVGALIVAGMDASPVLEPAEHDLDPVALSIEVASCGIGIFRFAFERMRAVILRSASAARNQSASYPLSRRPVKDQLAFSKPIGSAECRILESSSRQDRHALLLTGYE